MINRRVFLTGIGCAAAVGSATPVRPQQIIDTHTHFYDPMRPQGVPWPGKNEPILYQRTLPDRYLKAVKPLHITGTVVVEASPWLEDNQWVLDVARDNPIIVGVVGHLNPGTPEFKNHVARFSKYPLFRGFRTGAELILNRLDRPEMIDDLKRMVDADWELDIGGSSRLFPDLVRLADVVPKLRQVINHVPYDPPEEEPGAAARTAPCANSGNGRRCTPRFRASCGARTAACRTTSTSTARCWMSSGRFLEWIAWSTAAIGR